jgi:hypothetical protein
MILLDNAIGNFSWMELLWVGTAIAGLILGAQNHSEASKDIAAIAGIRNGRWRIARGNIRRERVRAAIFVMWAAFGVLAGIGPPNPNATPTSLILSAGLIATAALLALNSYYDRRDRQYLLHFRTSSPETQDQREDREFGEQRRELEAEHNAVPGGENTGLHS